MLPPQADHLNEDALALFRTTLRASLLPLGLAPDDEQMEKMATHYAAMVEANKSINLTRITRPEEAAVKHFADSLAVLAWARKTGIFGASLLDIGTGAGFPAVPVAVMRPDWQVTALEGTGKKAAFVARVRELLELKNLHVEHGHSDHWRGGRFALVAARAVSSLAQCMRTARPHLAAKGRLVVYKTADLEPKELEEARAAEGESGFQMKSRFEYELSIQGEQLRRALYILTRKT